MRARLIFLALILMTHAAFAQTAEYGQASAGALDMTAKRGSLFSGSLALTSSRAQGLGLGGSFGGTLVKDRVWFFASGEKSRSVVNTPTPQLAVSRPLTIPSSFLTLHSTSLLSPNSFFKVDVSQSRH